MSNKIIEVQNIKVNITHIDDNDYICISDIVKVKSDKSRAADVIRKKYIGFFNYVRTDL